MIAGSPMAGLELTPRERALLAGEGGRAAQKALEILTALGKIYEAKRLVPVASVQVAGVSYDNLGEAGLEYLAEMAAGGGRVVVPTTLNPAGMDLENWPVLGIDPVFAAQQQRVIAAFAQMGVQTTCTCTPYLVGNLPQYGQHLAWAESSAVAYANSVLGARSQREGGPSALAAALTGVTPECGLHLDENRRPTHTFIVAAALEVDGAPSTQRFGALGKVVGERLEALGAGSIAYLRGVPQADLPALKSLCASIATYGGAALFHIEGLTPEAAHYAPPAPTFTVTDGDLAAALAALTDQPPDEPVDFVSLGCPHLSLDELAHLARLLAGRSVRCELWITTSRPVRREADRLGYSAIIEASGAKFAVDTCCVVAPIRGRFRALATDSAKACYYAAAKHGMHTQFLSFEAAVAAALA